MKKLVVVMPWYGKVPDYFKFYVDGLRNVSFDTLLISDLDFRQFKMPDNVRVLKMTIGEFRELASSRLGVAVAIESPRKICDFRPMFGAIFQDYIEGYVYWGYGDCDLIYGEKLDEHVNTVVEGAYDVASMHKQYLSGPFAMIKNDERGRNLFRQNRDWQKVATTAYQYQFEECGKNVNWPRLEFGLDTIEDYVRDLEPFSYTLHVEERQGNIRYYHEDKITEHVGKRDVIRKKGRHIFLNETEIMIFHILFVKDHRYFKMPQAEWQSLDCYAVDNTGFYQCSDFRRWLMGRWRVFAAVCKSLRANGLSRIVTRFRLGR